MCSLQLQGRSPFRGVWCCGVSTNKRGVLGPREVAATDAHLTGPGHRAGQVPWAAGLQGPRNKDVVCVWFRTGEERGRWIKRGVQGVTPRQPQTLVHHLPRGPILLYPNPHF